MLGLANTLSSGSVPESRYSLDFDGADDYLNLDALAAGLSLADHAAYSISLWFNTTDSGNSQTGNILVGINESDGTNLLRVGVDTNPNKGIFFNGYSSGGNTTYGTTDFDDGAWHQLVLSKPAGSGADTTIYVDGNAIGTDDDDNLFSDATLFQLGMEYDSATPGDFYEGKITDFAMWNVALDSDAVTAIYNSGKPTNLTFDSGNYDNSSALLAYYRMGNGSFDDKANGVIHDQFGNTGGDLVTGGDMSDTSDWSKGTGWDVNDTTSNKAVHTNHSDDGGSTYDNLSQDIGVVKGRTYRVKWTLSGYGGSGNIRANVGGYNAGPNVSANGTYSHVIKNSHASSNSTLYLSVPDTADATIDDVSVFEVAPGYGAEMWDGANGDITNWSVFTNDPVSTNVIENDTAENAVKITYGNHSSGAFTYLRNAFYLTGDLVIGETYKLSFSTKVNQGDVAWRLYDTGGLNVIIGSVTSTGFVTQTLYFTATAEQHHYLWPSMASGESVWIKDISVKKLNGYPGLTSGGPTFSSDAP
jgi:hypothetical protein